jgi:hypothetical protein
MELINWFAILLCVIRFTSWRFKFETEIWNRLTEIKERRFGTDYFV